MSIVCSIIMSCPSAMYLKHSTEWLQARMESSELSESSYWRVAYKLFPYLNQRSWLNSCPVWTQRSWAQISGIYWKCAIASEMAMWNPGCLNHSWWLTTANRILWLYVSDEEPSENLKMQVTIIRIYAPMWFTINVQSSCKDGAIGTFTRCSSSHDSSALSTRRSLTRSFGATWTSLTQRISSCPWWRTIDHTYESWAYNEW